MTFLNRLYSHKTVVITSLVYMLFTFTVLYRRVHSDETITYFWGLVFDFQFALPLYFFFIMILSEIYPKSLFTRVMNRLFDIKIVASVGYVVLPLCAIFMILKVPGVWWSWPTVGLHVSTIMLVISVTRNRLTNIESMALAAAVISLVVGIWELPYQIGFRLTYAAPQLGMEETYKVIRTEILIQVPLIVGGLITLHHLSQKYGHKLFNANRYTVLFLWLFLVAYAAWFYRGLWVDINLNYTTYTWSNTPTHDVISQGIYKSSKVWLALIGYSLLMKNRKDIEVWKKSEVEHC